MIYDLLILDLVTLIGQRLSLIALRRLIPTALSLGRLPSIRPLRIQRPLAPLIRGHILDAIEAFRMVHPPGIKIIEDEELICCWL